MSATRREPARNGRRAAPRAGTGRLRTVRGLELVLSFALLCQFLLGMAVNLFVKVPDSHPGAKPPEYFSGVTQSVAWALAHGGIWLALHAGLGLALVLMALAALLAATRSGSRAAVVSTTVGFLAVLGAGFNGGSFLNYGEDFSSMIMASLFALALGSYVVGLWRIPTSKPRTTLRDDSIRSADRMP
ncbi:hypothetical protein [Sinomonas terrae]|uniref:Integral membrane protein n=1 Tax=Sinomonas terrae TaxID=2908838 RepID=A0ABS9TY81_9MICC|nr:hypothetical protein [Sinomonas terrae]MCH6469374.1 hypothetical protein [Sinomonas terrae]